MSRPIHFVDMLILTFGAAAGFYRMAQFIHYWKLMHR